MKITIPILLCLHNSNSASKSRCTPKIRSPICSVGHQFHVIFPSINLFCSFSFWRERISWKLWDVIWRHWELKNSSSPFVPYPNDKHRCPNFRVLAQLGLSFLRSPNHHYLQMSVCVADRPWRAVFPSETIVENVLDEWIFRTWNLSLLFGLVFEHEGCHFRKFRIDCQSFPSHKTEVFFNYYFPMKYETHYHR